MLMENDMDTEGAIKYNRYIENDLSTIEYDYELIHEKDTYEETFDMIRKINLVLVLPTTGDVHPDKLLWQQYYKNAHSGAHKRWGIHCQYCFLKGRAQGCPGVEIQ